MPKSNTTPDSQIDQGSIYHSPMKKPTQSGESTYSQDGNGTESVMLPVWRDLEGDHTENDGQASDSNWHVIQIECDQQH